MAVNRLRRLDLQRRLSGSRLNYDVDFLAMIVAPKKQPVRLSVIEPPFLQLVDNKRLE